MLTFPANRSLDAICLGRAGMDLYAREQNIPFFDVSGFDKHIGGSPANIALGMAKLNKKVGFLGVVSDDVIGHYVRDTLACAGIDISGIAVDSTGSRTSLAVTEIRPDNCAVVIYRNNAADLLLNPNDIDHDYVAGAAILVVSGTALSENPSREAALAAISIARNAGTQVVLDLDYRPYGWHSEAEAAECYWQAIEQSDCVIANVEEFAVLGVQGDAQQIARACFARVTADACALLCIKFGSDGSTIITRDGESHTQQSYRVDARKPFGAGDAYAAALLAGLLDDQSIAESARRGSAAAAIVVAGDACGESSPDEATLTEFLAQHSV